MLVQNEKKTQDRDDFFQIIMDNNKHVLKRHREEVFDMTCVVEYA